MKKITDQCLHTLSDVKISILLTALLIFNTGNAQVKQSVTGSLIEEKSNQPVPYATVVLFNNNGPSIAGGALSNEKGFFSIGQVTPGEYLLKVSTIGYKQSSQKISVPDTGLTDVGIISLQDTSIILGESIVVGERIKAKKESDRTTFFVTKKMIDASATGFDMLKLIPGIQIDIMHNLSLEGSSDILIFVDGMERDRNYLNQLRADQIDRVEVISVPPSKFDGYLKGCINVILKKDSESGITGQILSEIPLVKSDIFISPSYNIGYTNKKISMFTSYSGEMTYLNLHEHTSRSINDFAGQTGMITDQMVRQKSWSHRFNYGFDYFPGDRDQFNFYAYLNPYSRELDGDIFSCISGDSGNNRKGVREDYDRNFQTFSSFYYKHTFRIEGTELTADLSRSNLLADNRTDFVYEPMENKYVTQTNAVKPEQRTTTFKTDFTSLLLERLIINTGVKWKSQVSDDRISEFDYSEEILALYGNIIYKTGKSDLSLGLRAEKSDVRLKNGKIDPVLAFLPYAGFRFKINSGQSVQLTYNRTIRRPNIYQLNPSISFNDPYSFSTGNPLLRPELQGNIFVEHSVRFNGNYLATRLFWNKADNVISNLTFLNSERLIETNILNLGSVKQVGLQSSGTFRLGILTLNPYLKLFYLSASGNDTAKKYSTGNNKMPGIESGISAVVSFKHDIALSLSCRYDSPKGGIQDKTFSDMIYFISAEKTFKKNFKVGIVSACPFARTFTYKGSETKGPDFKSFYEGNVKLSTIPVWLKLSYQFSSGKKRNIIERSGEEVEKMPKKGF